MTASHTPPIDMERLNREVGALARRAGTGTLGVGVANLESGQYWTFNGERPFPMQSVFKAPLGAAALSEVEAGRFSLAETFTLTDEQLSPPRSPIADAWPARRDYTAEALLVAALSDSDNTAADVLMKRIGGPGAVTAWLRDKGVNELRVDRYEREIQPDVYGMASFRLAWKGEAAFSAALATIPPARRRQAMLAYMADPRDTATPRGMQVFLAKLDRGELIKPASVRRLLDIMARTPRGAERLKAGFPKDALFAHKIGTSGVDQGLSAAFNDAGILILADHRRYAVTALLSGSALRETDRDAFFADLGRVIIGSLGHGTR
jgi:beta-lactamase class A